MPDTFYQVCEADNTFYQVCLLKSLCFAIYISSYYYQFLTFIPPIYLNKKLK